MSIRIEKQPKPSEAAVLIQAVKYERAKISDDLRGSDYEMFGLIGHQEVRVEFQEYYIRLMKVKTLILFK